MRATAIVLEAELAGNRPPAMAMDALSGNSTLPDLGELKEVLNMQYLVRCLEWMYFHADDRHRSEEQANLFREMRYGRYPSERRQFPNCLSEGIPGVEKATIDSFRDLFYRAICRLLIAGAVLAGAYLDLLFRAREEGNDGFLLRNGYVWYEDECWEKIAEIDDEERDRRDDADRAYVRKTAVYNYDVEDWSEIGEWKYGQYESVFGPFASWIVEDGRKRQRDEPRNSAGAEPDWAEDSEDVGAVRELMLLMVAYDHFNGKIENGPRQSNPLGPEYMPNQDNRTVSIIRFGVFHVEQITMPSQLSDLKTDLLFAEFHPAFADSMGKWIPYQFDIWWTITEILEPAHRWQYNWWNRENPGPPPMMQLWHFALRKYLNLGFRYRTFWMPRRPDIWDCIWWKDVGRGEVFLNPDWAVVQKHQSGVISWDYEVS